MDRNTVILLISLASITLLIATTASLFFRTRRDYRQLSLINERLVKAAQPPNGTVVVAVWVGILYFPAILVLDYLDDPAWMRSILSLLYPLGLLSFVWLQSTFHRLRALEAIVRISRPDIYAEIADKKAD